MRSKQNAYASLACDLVAGTNAGMGQYLKSKARLCSDIQRLSYHVIAEAFGIRGKHNLEGARHSMMLYLDQSTQQFSSWREIADQVKHLSGQEFATIDFRRK